MGKPVPKSKVQRKSLDEQIRNISTKRRKSDAPSKEAIEQAVLKQDNLSDFIRIDPEKLEKLQTSIAKT